VSEQLPERIERLISIHEEELARELRALTGRNDITVEFDRTQILDRPKPVSLPEDYAESAE
jgi:hypothetical protein